MKYIILVFVIIFGFVLCDIETQAPPITTQEQYDEALIQCGNIEKFNDRNMCRINVTKRYKDSWYK